MSKTTRAAGTSPFAHLLASTSALASRMTGRRAEDETDKDEETRKARRAEEDEKRKDEDARRAEEDERREEEDARRAEEDESDTSDENDGDADADEGGDDDADEPDESDAKGRRAKKAKKAEDDDDSGDDESDEMKGKKAERQRWASVLGHKASGEGRIATACNMLATTDMDAASIISTLSTIPAVQQAKAPGLRERMQGSRNASLGIDGGKPGGGSLASRIVAAGKKRRGEEA